MGKHLISEQTIRDLVNKGSKSLDVPKGSIVTPLAAELAITEGIALVRTSEVISGESSPKGKEQPASVSAGKSESGDRIVAFGSDHGGYQLKGVLKAHAKSLGYEVLDVGTTSEEACDYPDFAYAVAMAVVHGKAWRGVMIDGAGIGSCVAANKVPSIRAACCHNEFVARNAREHNDTNVLTLGSRVTGSEVCKGILKVWLETIFAGGRHKQRVEKIVEVERKFVK